MSIDERGMHGLMEESQDLHSTAMTQLRPGLDEVVELGLEARRKGDIEVVAPARRTFIRKSLFAAGALGVGFGAIHLGRATRIAYADNPDTDMLQTAASLENLAVAVYTKAAGLPPATSGASIPVVKAFVVMTIQQHTDHANAFNAAATKLGAKAQTNPDKTVFDAVVTPALAKIMGPADVVKLATTLEDAAAQTYVMFGSTVDDANALKTFATVAPVEAQHVAVLNAVGALIAGGHPELIMLPPDLTKLPGAAGSIGFPKSFYATDQARGADEGKVA